MKIISARITNFQSIRDSNEFEIGEITCLVGKNEAGKTAILKALNRLNPLIPENSNFDVTDDYPRADVEDYRQEVENNGVSPAIVVRAKFEINEKEINEIESEFGHNVLLNNILTLSKGYENKLFVSLGININIAINSLINQAQIPLTLTKKLGNAKSEEELIQTIDQIVDEDNSEHIQRLKLLLKKIEESNGLMIYIYTKYLKMNVPKFMYFDEFFIMKGMENIELLKKRVDQNTLIDSDYPLLGLIDLARLNLSQLLNPSRTEELINKLEGAGNHLSKQVLKYWTQNKHVTMKFDVRQGHHGDPEGMQSGTNIWGRVYDSKRQVSTPLGTRSRGFVWFFSFLAWFDQQQRKNNSLILLLDEPGLFLHGRAQADLLRYIETELSTKHQVIYTTHSPFMVDPEKFSRVRIVQDKSTDDDNSIPRDLDGTKVLTEIFDATEDSLFPLQGAMGYDIYQSLFIGPYCLVVEGVSDLLYLQTISAYLESQNREGLDRKWTITPVGGADKVPTFVALLGAQRGMKIATLLDIEKKQQQKIESLFQRKLLLKQNVLTYADFTLTPEADIEDMFGDSFFIDIVNKEYEKDLSKPIEMKNLNQHGSRILVKIENYLKNNPLNENRQFSHYRPARYFSENTDQLNIIPIETLDKFEAAFKKINSINK